MTERTPDEASEVSLPLVIAFVPPGQSIPPPEAVPQVTPAMPAEAGTPNVVLTTDDERPRQIDTAAMEKQLVSRALTGLTDVIRQLEGVGGGMDFELNWGCYERGPDGKPRLTRIGVLAVALQMANKYLRSFLERHGKIYARTTQTYRSLSTDMFTSRSCRRSSCERGGSERCTLVGLPPRPSHRHGTCYGHATPRPHRRPRRAPPAARGRQRGPPQPPAHLRARHPAALLQHARPGVPGPESGAISAGARAWAWAWALYWPRRPGRRKGSGSRPVPQRIDANADAGTGISLGSRPDDSAACG